MSDSNSWLEDISLLSKLDHKHIDALLITPLKITKELFSSTTHFNLEQFAFGVNQYIQANPMYEETISNIIDIFSFVREKQYDLLTEIQNAIPINFSMKSNIQNIFNYQLPWIFNLDITQSPILEFIYNDDFENLQKFVSTKVDFDFSQTFEIKWEEVNLLDICAYYGSVQCFKYLVCNNAPFSEDVCPFSICGGNYEIIHYLENNFTEQNFSEEICLEMSIAYHRYEITDWLILNYGAKLKDAYTAIKSFNYTVFVLLAQDHNLSSNDLSAAANSGNMPIVQYFCEVAKADPKANDINGRTPLYWACENDSLSIVQYLCEVQKVNTEATDREGETPFHIASQYGNLSIVQYLCEVQRVNTEAKDKNGKTPLHYASQYGRLQVVQYLCEVAKVNTEATDEFGWTPLHYACVNGCLQVVQYLCEVAKVNTEAKDKNGKTPLHYACYYGRLQVVQYLCEVAKVNTEAKDKNGNAPLHYACKNGHLPIVQYLCEVAKANTRGAYEKAEYQPEVKEYLKKYL